MQKILERTRYLSMLETFKDDTGHIKVITGVRRCGKSTLLRMFSRRLMESGVRESEMLMLNFESTSMDGISNHTSLNRLLEERVPRTGRFYLFLDEIQRVEGWERSVNALMVDTEADIYITGSNARLLSTELSTFLTGRYVEIRMLPLSFKEHFELRGEGRKTEDVFKEYLRTGGFPGIDPSLGEEAVSAMLQDLYGSIVLRDAVSRGRVRNPVEMEKMVTYLMLNIGNPISSTAMSKALHINQRTVERYLSLLQEACLFYRADRYDLRSTSLSPTPKYYAVDAGLRNNIVGMASKDLGRVLENIVFLELTRRGYKITVGKWDSKEIDFVTEKNGRKEYWQSCLGYYDDDTEARELAPLRAIKDSNPKTVVLLNASGTTTTEDGIKEIGIVDFLMAERGRRPTASTRKTTN